MINERECAEVGLVVDVVERLARRIERCAQEAETLGLTIFGGSGHGDLRLSGGSGEHRPLIVASMDGAWDGGDGGAFPDEYGLMRGE